MQIGFLLAVALIVLGIAGVALTLVFGLLLVLIPPSFHTVQSGEIAVVKVLGEAKTVRSAGTYFDFWLLNTYDVYDAKVQNMEIDTQAYSKDAQTMGVNMTVQYKIDVSKAIEIVSQSGSMDILANRIESIATEK